MRTRLELIKKMKSKEYSIKPLTPEEKAYLSQFKGDNTKMAQELSNISFQAGFDLLAPLVRELMEGMSETEKEFLLEQYLG